MAKYALETKLLEEELSESQESSARTQEKETENSIRLTKKDSLNFRFVIVYCM